MNNVARHGVRPVLALLTCGAAVVGFFSVQRSLRAQGRTPFTAITRHTARDRSGKVSLTDTGLFAMRNDGSTVRVQNIATPDNAGVVTQRLILDLARVEEVAIDDLTESKTTTPLLRATVQLYQGQPMCTNNLNPVHATLLGYDVIRNVKYIGDQTKRIMRREEWRAPALDCLALMQTLILGSTEANSYSATVKEVSYLERSPSERTKEFKTRYPQVSYPECAITSDQQMDELYYKRQGDKGQ
jgi:hypothetical protein